jgi:hypothetical protein
MPPATPGVVRGDEPALVLAWADAFDRLDSLLASVSRSGQRSPGADAASPSSDTIVASALDCSQPLYYLHDAGLDAASK